jgi:hypothetical protein
MLSVPVTISVTEHSGNPKHIPDLNQDRPSQISDPIKVVQLPMSYVQTCLGLTYLEEYLGREPTPPLAVMYELIISFPSTSGELKR